MTGQSKSLDRDAIRGILITVTFVGILLLIHAGNGHRKPTPAAPPTIRYGTAPAPDAGSGAPATGEASGIPDPRDDAAWQRQLEDIRKTTAPVDDTRSGYEMRHDDAYGR